MKYLEYREKRTQGTFDFPVAYYHIDKNHPRYHMTYHWHPEYEIIRILEGSFHMTIDEQTFLFQTGDIVFIQDGILHGGIPTNCVYECLVFDLNILVKENHICKKELEAIKHHRIIVHSYLSNTPELTSIIDYLFLVIREKELGYEFLVQGSLYFLFGIILKEKLFDIVEVTHHLSNDKLKHLKKVLRFIEEHYTENITLNDLANIAGMNPKYFCRYFKEMTGQTPINYLNYYRVECAKEQLSTTDLSITDIAINCGFNDISYFIRTFKKYKGITPKQYVKKQFFVNY